MRKASTALLWLAAVGGTAMGGYHYFLPIQFRWLDDIRPAHGMVAWSLLMINTCFSTLLILGSLMVAFAAKSGTKDPMARVIVACMAIF
jgi:H+/Cl- antiporter ClcA